MSTPPAKPSTAPATFVAVVLLLGSSIGILVSLGNWYNEFAAGPAVPFAQATVTRISESPDYGTPRRKQFRLLVYPVLEYTDERSVKRQLWGKGVFPGSVDAGDELPIGKTGERIVVMNTWYRSQPHLTMLLTCGAFLGFSLLYFTVWKPSPSRS